MIADDSTSHGPREAETYNLSMAGRYEPPEEPLAPDALVIRFGSMTLEKLRKSIQHCKDTLGYYGLSFYGENGMDKEEISEMAHKGHGKMQVSTIERVAKAELGLPERVGRYPHLSLRFAEAPTDEELKRLMETFDEPESNPHAD